MEPVSETKLRKEIKYLTRLIDAHKAIKQLQTQRNISNNNGKVQENKSAGAATPSWSHSGSISSHLANHKSTLPSSSSSSSKDMKRKKNMQYQNLVYKPSTSDQHITIDLTTDGLSTGTESSLNVPNTNAVTVAFDSGSSTECISDTSTTTDSLKHKDPVNEVLSLLDGELDEEENSEPMDLSISEILSGGKGNEEEGTLREGEVAQSVVGDKRKIKQRGCEEFMNMGKMKKRKMSDGESKGAYVWTSKAAGKNLTTRRRSKSRLPERFKLKWRRKSLEDDNRTGQSRSGEVFNKSEITQVTSTYGSIPAATMVSRKRRRSSSGSSSHVNKSPFIIRKYKMLRVSSLSDTQSFSQRRLRYLMKQSNHSPSSLSSFKKRRKISVSTPAKRNGVSIHRVWKPGGEEGEREVTESVKSVSSEDGNQTRSTERKESKAGLGHVFQKARFGGLETKTKRGNKQWISDAMMKEKLENKNKRSSEEVDKDRRHERGRWNKRRKCHVVSIQGNQYMMSKRGKSLKRVVNTSAIPTKHPKKRRLSSSSSLKGTTSVKKLLANNVVKKSVNRVWLAKKDNKNQQNKNQFCIYYNRFGRCNRGDKCPFTHDPKHVAVCSKFLKGICDKLDGKCPFSHNVAKEKMPVCSFFLRGLCTRENCPYLHVSVGRNAELCPDFIRGYCSLGEECTKQHILDCPEFAKEGSCPRGKRCPLRHRKRRRSKSSLFNLQDMSKVPITQSKSDGGESSRTVQVSSLKEPYPFKRLRRKFENKLESVQRMKSLELVSPTQLITPGQLEFIPLETDTAPDFIAL